MFAMDGIGDFKGVAAGLFAIEVDADEAAIFAEAIGSQSIAGRRAFAPADLPPGEVRTKAVGQVKPMGDVVPGDAAIEEFQNPFSIVA